MNDTYYWEHVEDTDVHCPTATLLEGKTWLCLDHGAPVSYVKLTPVTELTMEQFKVARKTQVISDAFDRADGDVPEEMGGWAPLGHGKLVNFNVSKAQPGTSAHHMQERDRPKVERARELHEQYAPMWAQVLRLAYEQQIQFHKDDPIPNAMAAMSSIRDGDATLRQVGWFCAGGHVAPHNAPDFLVPPSLKLEDPCVHAVPVFVLVNAEHSTPVETIDRSGDHPDASFVRSLVGTMVRVTIHSSDTVYTGKLSTYQHDGENDLAIWLELSPDHQDVVIPWVDLHTCEPLL